jgi:hypothetical protein
MLTLREYFIDTELLSSNIVLIKDMTASSSVALLKDAKGSSLAVIGLLSSLFVISSRAIKTNFWGRRPTQGFSSLKIHLSTFTLSKSSTTSALIGNQAFLPNLGFFHFLRLIK